VRTDSRLSPRTAESFAKKLLGSACEVRVSDEAFSPQAVLITPHNKVNVPSGLLGGSLEDQAKALREMSSDYRACYVVYLGEGLIVPEADEWARELARDGMLDMHRDSQKCLYGTVDGPGINKAFFVADGTFHIVETTPANINRSLENLSGRLGEN
jgi:hypothetical protein